MLGRLARIRCAVPAPLHKPVHDVRNQIEVWGAEVLSRNQPWVAQGAHLFREVCTHITRFAHCRRTATCGLRRLGCSLRSSRKDIFCSRLRQVKSAPRELSPHLPTQRKKLFFKHFMRHAQWTLALRRTSSSPCAHPHECTHSFLSHPPKWSDPNPCRRREKAAPASTPMRTALLYRRAERRRLALSVH